MKMTAGVRFGAVVVALFAAGVLIAGGWHSIRHKGVASGEAAHKQKYLYCCPMHPDFTADKPGDCTICGMSLVKKQKEAAPKDTGKKKILYYRNPMNPEATSPVPMKDSMGMDYVPVYEEGAPAQETGIYMSPERQQMIGVTKEKVEIRALTRRILTVGRVAYDPALFVAQQEYLQARKAYDKINENGPSSIQEQMESLVNAAKSKLILSGMTGEEIDALVQGGKPQENLYLPSQGDTVWVYMTIYEYEAGLVKERLPVAIEAVAFPGEKFHGVIVAITPVLNSMTRSLQVRAEVGDPGHKLKPEMFVNAGIDVDLGEKLSVPETAVLDTGIRKIVYRAQEGDVLEAREVTLGQKAQGYYEVTDGLKEGDVVVTSGNFLVDSESKLNGAL